jgi:hypothetical protein
MKIILPESKESLNYFIFSLESSSFFNFSGDNLSLFELSSYWRERKVDEDFILLYATK